MDVDLDLLAFVLMFKLKTYKLKKKKTSPLPLLHACPLTLTRSHLTSFDRTNSENKHVNSRDEFGELNNCTDSLSDQFYLGIYLKDLFTYFGERKSTWVGGGEEEVGERISSWLLAEHRAPHGAWSWEPDILIWAEVKGWMLNCLSHLLSRQF